jgi:hypothetical protein
VGGVVRQTNVSWPLAHPRASASSAVDQPTGRLLPRRADVSPAGPASSTQFKLGAKPLSRQGSRTDDKGEEQSSPNAPACVFNMYPTLLSGRYVRSNFNQV